MDLSSRFFAALPIKVNITAEIKQYIAKTLDGVDDIYGVREATEEYLEMFGLSEEEVNSVYERMHKMETKNNENTCEEKKEKGKDDDVNKAVATMDNVCRSVLFVMAF